MESNKVFTLVKTEQNARRGSFVTPHGIIETPVFMNVGTQAAVKGGVASEDLEQIGCQVELSNTYHLHLRPGEEIIKDAGGLHRFMNWNKPILTDSGGFQIYSLSKLRKIKEEGVYFSSHIDGRKIFMSPEDCIRIQSSLGSDIAMAFDECVGIPASYEYVKDSCALTLRWLERCRAKLEQLNSLSDTVNPGQVLFGINQGATFKDLRVRHMQDIAELDLPGYAIGGLAVGESTAEMYETIETIIPWMPENKPRYLMGVGTPENIVECVYRGIDFFDCVMPARNGRHGKLYTENGVLNIKNERYSNDFAPVDSSCGCPLCRYHTRAYLRHLFKAGEMLALRLSVLHNLYYYNNLMSKIRNALDSGCFTEFRNNFNAQLVSMDKEIS